MKCFYHSADLDGHCSGAIVKQEFPECELFGVNYGKDAIVEEKVKPGETVFLVDFTLQPFSRMLELNKKCHLIWIDHHKTEIEEAEKYGVKIKGIQKVGLGACALTWDWVFPGESRPLGVQLLAEYDVWNHSNKHTLPFQYGMRQYKTLPEDSWGVLWQDIFYHHELNFQKILNEGALILRYEKSQNSKMCSAYSFETSLNGYSAICINRGFTNSNVFDSIDRSKYDLMITFCRLPLPHKKWTVSIYTHRDDLDLGQIARKYGGGGHQKAAGFQCENLPFDY